LKNKGGISLTKKPNQKTLSDIKKSAEKFVPILKRSKKQSVNEADTRIIINAILEKVLGYDKYFEVTAEQMIKSSYADYAIILNKKPVMIIEVKAIDVKLKQDHVRQAVNYAANEGIKWAILTNGFEWRVYRIKVDKKVDQMLFFTVDFSDNISDEDSLLLYCLSKDSFLKGYIEEFWQYKSAINPSFFIKALFSDSLLNSLKKELKKISGYNVSKDEIVDILITQIIRSDVIEKNLSKEQIHSQKEEKSIDLENLSESQKEILLFLAKAQNIVSLDEIKNYLHEKEIDMQLSGPFKAINRRLGEGIVKTDEGYYIKDYVKKLINEKFSN
jgi:hypothetical protein